MAEEVKKTAPAKGAKEANQTVTTKPTVKVSDQFVIAEIEQRNFDKTTGERLSNPSNCTFTFLEWKQFQEHGPRQGWFVNKVLEAPKGTDLTYVNPKRR